MAMRVEATFKAVDRRGNQYTIHVLRDDHDVRDRRSGRVAAQDRLGQLQTSDGRFVSYVNPGIYEIIDGVESIRITSTDLNAP
jgi:hypothetical protein